MPTASPDLAAISAGLRTSFPALERGTPLRLLGVGFGSVVVETPCGQVFRIARNRAAAEGHRREEKLLPALRQRVALPIPDPRWYAAPSAALPYGAIGYAKLPGVPLTPAALASGASAGIVVALAHCLADLHRFPVADALAIGVPDDDARWAAIEESRDQSLPPLRQVLTAQEYERVAFWWDSFLLDERMRVYAPALCHGDLWYENILVDDAARRIIGIIDFENVSIGDPAQDFATLRYLGERFSAAVLAEYQSTGGAVDPGFRYRIRRLWEMREACVPDDPAELDDQVRKLRAGPILASSL
jgi:aminoglycoside 2''-phosphotransferase